jgi:YD repeat-containing protein
VPAAAEEAVTTYSQVNNSTWTNPETGAQQTGTLVQQTAPDGTVYKQFSHASGWDAGLPLLVEVWSGGVRRKWTSVKFTQDNTALTNAQNPRLVETNVYDGVNRRRTTVEYSAASAAFNLPWIVAEYAADAATVLRRTYLDYKWDAVYIDRRIIGLPFRHSVYDGAGSLVAKTEYNYDWGGELFADTPAAARQHDRTNYGPAFLAGRGNLSQTSRYDITDPNNAAGTIKETKWRHNSTGSVLMERDHLWHQKFFDYADSFSDGVNRNTFAYPTKVTDEDGYAATAQYNFDFGAVTRTHTPTSGTGTAITYADAQVQYDAHGRPQQVTNLVNGAYKRWVYDPLGRVVHTFETIKSTAQADEFHSWRVTDGAGRLRALGADHPGSAGGYTGQYFVHDRMGRLAQASNPTEINSAWVPAGDDAAWVYTLQAYDWQGRPTQTTNPDGSTRVLTYGGCGCAGGEVTNAQDEHGRNRRLTKDVLGRLAKVEELNWDETVYSTTAYTYNVRDQLTQISQQGQLRTFEYDGHGRLSKRTTPEQGATAYAYNGDDTVSVKTDARGATSTYGYNARHLVTSLTYGVAAGKTKTWADTAHVTYAYDAAGNRTSMTDGQGTATYHYDSLSRLDWEERNFTALPGTSDPPAYRLTYGYNVGGELTSITYPSQFGSPAPQVSYAYDEAGRPSAVGGANYGGVTNYANTLRYRAFGALKAMTYSNGRTLSAAYDNRLRPTKWDVLNVQGYGYKYDYFGERTGRVTYAQNLYDATLDRSYEYDHVGRLGTTHSGAEARAHAFSGQWGVADGPFSHGYDYDAWGNLTHRFGWGGEVQGGAPASSTDLSYTYSNNRRTGPASPTTRPGT